MRELENEIVREWESERWESERMRKWESEWDSEKLKKVSKKAR